MSARKVIVITGSSRGIGLGLSREFLRRGHEVILNGRDEGKLQAALNALKDEGFNPPYVAGDVREESTFQALIQKAVSTHGKLDIWINNAGIPQTNAYFHDLKSEDITRLISINITALILGTKAAIQFFRQQGYGQVFNMEGFGSDGRMRDKLSLYGTSKRAVHYFSKSLSKELKHDKVRVGILSPGMVRTEFLTAPLRDADPEERSYTQKVFDIMAEEVDQVTPFLADRVLTSTRNYERIEYLTFRRLVPKILKLMMIKK